jgi:hypothetical protein
MLPNLYSRTAVLVASLPVILLTSCSPAAPPVPDMGPVGDGLKVIGFALIGVSVVITVGRMIR